MGADHRFNALPLDDFSSTSVPRHPATAAATASFEPTHIASAATAGLMTDPQQVRFDTAAGADTALDGLAASATAVRPALFPHIDRETMNREAADRRAADRRAGFTGGITGLDPADEAARVLSDARATARTMLAQAREAIAAERVEAVKAGLAEGRARGTSEADEEMAGLVRTCEQIGIQVMEERARLMEDSKSDVVELAMAVAQRIVNAAIDVDETLVIEACRGAMRKAFQRDQLQVLAHPADLAMLREAGPQLARELGGVEHLDFVEERRLDRGSVMVRTPAGEIDGTIAGKSDKIEQALREGIEQRRAERRTH